MTFLLQFFAKDTSQKCYVGNSYVVVVWPVGILYNRIDEDKRGKRYEVLAVYARLTGVIL